MQTPLRFRALEASLRVYLLRHGSKEPSTQSSSGSPNRPLSCQEQNGIALLIVPVLFEELSPRLWRACIVGPQSDLTGLSVRSGGHVQTRSPVSTLPWFARFRHFDHPKCARQCRRLGLQHPITRFSITIWVVIRSRTWCVFPISDYARRHHNDIPPKDDRVTPPRERPSLRC
jgi:hypothetical protein